jgi:hypothetical protein
LLIKVYLFFGWLLLFNFLKLLCSLRIVWIHLSKLTLHKLQWFKAWQLWQTSYLLSSTNFIFWLVFHCNRFRFIQQNLCGIVFSDSECVFLQFNKHSVANRFCLLKCHWFVRIDLKNKCFNHVTQFLSNLMAFFSINPLQLAEFLLNNTYTNVSSKVATRSITVFEHT